MARNLGHARADDTANETKNVSHNTLNYRDFTMKTDLKFRLPPESIVKHELFTGSPFAQKEVHNIHRKL